MTFNFDMSFDEVEFISETTQSIEYWASETKLNIEDGKVKQTGAAFISSMLAGAVGGAASVLVSADENRRRVMLESVDGSVWVGGNGVTDADGWELRQGERLELDASGDVFCWWTNDVTTTLLEQTAVVDDTTKMKVLSLIQGGSATTEALINLSNEGSYIAFDGEVANGQVVYSANRSRVDNIVDHFDVVIPAGKRTLIVDFSAHFSSAGAIQPCVGVSWDEVDDVGGRMLWQSAFSSSGEPFFNKTGAVEIYLGDSDVSRFKRVYIWDKANESYLNYANANVIPARKVKVIELNN